MRYTTLLTRPSTRFSAGAVATLFGVLWATSPIAVSSTDAATAHSHGGTAMLLFTRQICTSEEDPCWEIVVSDADESNAHVVAGPYPRSVWDDHFIANWAPDGRHVIFMADLGGGQAIWQIGSDGTHLHAIFTPSGDTGIDDGPAFTPDGKRIVFTRCCPASSGYALWSINADGHDLKQVTSEVAPPGVDGPSDNLPQVSPDGRDVAYHRNAHERNRISIAPLRTGVFTDITDPDLDAQIPNWSPDGGQLVFQGGDANVWRVNRDGSGLVQLTTDGRSLNPSYTPDGHIIFGRILEDGTRDLFLMDADGDNATLVNAAPGVERFPHIIEVPGD